MRFESVVTYIIYIYIIYRYIKCAYIYMYTYEWRIQSFFGQTSTNNELTLKGTFSKYVLPNAHNQVRKEIKREKQTFA